jgi:uncharacterized membrane protein
MPALPLDEAGKYVAAAYVVFVALILAYVAIMAAKLERIERELGELADLAEVKSVRASDGVAGHDVAEGKAVGTSDEVAVQTAGPAGPLEPKPAGNVAEGEASGGDVLPDV